MKLYHNNLLLINPIYGLVLRVKLTQDINPIYNDDPNG